MNQIQPPSGILWVGRVEFLGFKFKELPCIFSFLKKIKFDYGFYDWSFEFGG